MIEYLKLRCAITGCIAVFLFFCCIKNTADTVVSTNLESSIALSTPAITNAIQFQTFAKNSPKEGYPVHLQVIVTYSDPQWNMFQCQDDSGVLYMPSFSRQEEVKSGFLIDLKGLTILKNGNLSLDCKQLAILNRNAFPKPRLIGHKELIKGGLGGVWIEIHGIIRTMRRDDRLYLSLLTGGEQFLVLVLKHQPNELSLPLDLLDATVKIRGIAANTPHVPGRIESITPEIFVEGMDQIEVISPSTGNPSKSPVVPISTVLKTSLSENESVNRVHVQGVVNKIGDNTLYVQDPTGRIKVQSANARYFETDSVVGVQGVPVFKSGEWILQDAVIEKVISSTPEPKSPLVKPSSGATQTQNLPILRSLGEILGLSSVEAKKGYPVHLKAVATYSDLEWNLLFVQDNTGAICIDNSAKTAIRTGDEVDIRGLTINGSFLPTVTDVSLTSLGRGIIPSPSKVSLTDMLTGDYDCRWVEVEGLARSLSDNWGHEIVKLTSGGGRFEMIVPGFVNKPPPTNYLGAKLQVRGVCAMKQNAAGQSMGIYLHVPGTNDIVVVEKPVQDPFSLPVRKIRELLRHRPHESMGSQTKVMGVVTLTRPGSGIYMQDESGGTLAELNATANIKPGQIVEIAGYPEMGAFSPKLQDAICRGDGKKRDANAQETHSQPDTDRKNQRLGTGANTGTATGRRSPKHITPFCIAGWLDYFHGRTRTERLYKNVALVEKGKPVKRYRRMHDSIWNVGTASHVPITAAFIGRYRGSVQSSSANAKVGSLYSGRR